MSLEVEIRRLSRGASLLGMDEMIQQEDPTAYSLPKYTVFYIFSFINSRKYISKCKLVSKLWNVIASDAIFGWFQAIAMPLGPMITKPVAVPFDYLAPIKRGKPIDFHEITPLSLVVSSTGSLGYPRPWDFACQAKFRLARKDDTTIFTGYCYFPSNFSVRDESLASECAKLSERQQKGISPLWHSVKSGFLVKSEKFLPELVDICNKNPRLWRCELWQQNSETFPYVFTLEVNLVELEAMVEKDQIIPLADILSYHALSENLAWGERNTSKGTHTKAHIPMKSYATQQQPMGFSKSITLYKYQLDAVSWMKSIEDDIHVGFEVVDTIAWRSAKTSVLFQHPYITELVPVQSVAKHISRVYPKGGILGDDMGLGKTTEIIALILSNPGDPSIISSLECEINNKKHLHQMDVTNEAHLFKTNATLVICPDHLAKQWHEEIEKNTRPHLNVVAFSDIRSLKCCPYGDVVNADAVIIPASLLEHQSYLSIGSDDSNYYYNLAVPREQRVNEYLEKLWKSGREVMQVRGPVLEHFLWRRIVLDEAHDLVRGTSVPTALTAKFWWYVSGTPFPNVNVLKRVVNVLKFPEAKTQTTLHNYIDIVLNNLYWRNTKQSVKDEYEVPPIVEDLVLLDLTRIENLLLQFCEQDYSTYHKPDMSMVVNHVGFGLHFGLDISLSKLRLEAIKFLEERIVNSQASIQRSHASIAHSQLKLQQLEMLNTPNKQEIQYEKILISSNTASIAECTSRIALDTNFAQQLTEAVNYDGPDMSKDAGIPELDESDLAELVPKQETPNGNGMQAKSDAPSEAKSGEELLPFSVVSLGCSLLFISVTKEIVDMTVPQLKEELQSRGIPINSKLRKADLQKILKEAVKNNVQPKADFKKRKNESKNSNNSSPKKAKTATSASSPKKSKDVRTTADKVKEQNVLRWMVENEGTKLGNLLFYLKRLWEDNPAAKVIIFSKFTEVLRRISSMLEANKVNHNSMEGGIHTAQNQLKGFKKESEVRALLLNLSRLSTGTNIIEATHIIFMEPAYDKSQEAQAIGRAFRQGQTVRVAVVRLITRDTIDYKSHMALHGNSKLKTVEGQAASHSGQPKIQRTSSLITTIATTPSLQNTTDMLNLLEEKENEEAQMVSTPVLSSTL